MLPLALTTDQWTAKPGLPQPSAVAPSPTSLLHSLYAPQDWADVVLQTKGGNLKAHRLVLKGESTSSTTLETGQTSCCRPRGGGKLKAYRLVFKGEFTSFTPLETGRTLCCRPRG